MEQQQNQPLVPGKNSDQRQPSLPVYTEAVQDNQTEESDLPQLLAVVRRRALVIGTVAIVIAATVWFSTLNQQAKYEGKFQLLVEPVTAESKLTGLTEIPEENANQQESGLDYETQIQILQSPKLMAPIIKQISTRYPDISYDSLITNLAIARLGETKILEVRYQDLDRQKIQFVLQQVAKGYLNYSLQGRQTSLSQGSQFINSQLPQLKTRVNSLQKELQQFRQKYNFIAPEVKAQQLEQQVSSIELQRWDTQKQLAETRALYATMQNQSEAAQALKEAPIYQKLLSQVRDIESQIATELTRFREDSPIIQVLREKRENLLPLLQQEAVRVLNNRQVEVANQISLLQVREAEIARVESNLNQQVKQLPTLTRQYTDLQRELKIATDSLNRFLEKRESLQIETAQKEIPWQLITTPDLPPQPISPGGNRQLVLGAIAGLLGGMGAALLLEKLDNVFHSHDEIKKVTNLPLLGMIPFHKLLKQPPAVEAVVKTKPDGYNLGILKINKAQDESYFALLEPFRYLYTTIRLLDTQIHSLVISSSVNAEGKSTVAAHLAQAAAAMGRRVLLVDADFRLPKIHSLLSLPNERGLSNVVSTNLQVLEVIQRSPLSDNLFVLTSGRIPLDPTKLLSSKKMQNIMEQLRQEFDLVIYDTPPLLGLADSIILATHTDAIVLVVQISKTKRYELMQALELLKISRAPILGIVSNRVKNYNFTPYTYCYGSRT